MRNKNKNKTKKRDGIYDCAWSEINENHLISSCGDGTIRLWDLGSKMNPLRAYQGHNAEVYTVDWNLVSKQHFLSGAWDRLIKLWDPIRAVSMGDFIGHKGVLYEVRWCPHRFVLLFFHFFGIVCFKTIKKKHKKTNKKCKKNSNAVFASVAEDCRLNIWDVRRAQAPPMISIPAHQHEILSCDFWFVFTVFFFCGIFFLSDQ